ncbi:TonB-dependent receptor [Thauera sp. 27]|uniref:TonB-dependent receptor domain-containing protein n=1 Tax=Thauera sp. 27 TaxID=305700 RepID=UPI0002CD7B00|nr:TonB-dependent receptor [Thauera sp. 27]ENO77412.1 TonB-dependent receptor [Thauera sp. 27]
MNLRYSQLGLCVGGLASAVLAVPVYAQEHIAPTVVVTATRQPVKANELLADVTVIDRAQIERAAASNVVDLLSRQPGVQFARNGGPGASVSLYLRGTKPDQTKILVDGVPFNSTALSGSSLQYLSLNNVERIEIVRGAASAIYGADAIGGVINIITRTAEPGLRLDGYAGAGSRDTRQGDLAVSGGDERWRFRLHVNSLNTDGFSSRRGASNRDADDDRYRNEGYGGALSFHPAEGHEVGVSFLEQSGTVQYDSFGGSGNFDDRASFKTSVFNAFVRNRLTSSWSSRLSYGRTDEDRADYSEPAPWDPLGITRRESTNETLSWQNDIALPIGTGLVVVERFEQVARPRETFAEGNVQIDSLGLGWTADLGPHSWQANVRHDDHSRYGDKLTGGVSYGYQLAPDLRASAGVSKAFKSPSLDQLYNVSYGNPDLKPENALNRELGLTWASGNQLVTATYFINTIEDMIGWSGGYANVDKARIRGLTLAYALNVDGWDFAANADFLDAKDRTTGFRLGRRAKQSMNVSATRTIGAWTLGGEWALVGSRYDTNFETNRLGGYGLVNLTARYAIDRDWSVEARADNVFDKQYETARGYGTPGAGVFIGVRYAPR